MPQCRKPHGATPPNLPVNGPSGDALVLDDGDASSQWLAGVRVLELELDRPQLVDLRLDECDLSAIEATGFGMRRVAMRGTRLRGVTLANGQYDDGLMETARPMSSPCGSAACATSCSGTAT